MAITALAIVIGAIARAPLQGEQVKIAIIGAGISGIIAEGALSHPDNEIKVFDPKESVGFSSEHKAVMRLRDDRIKDYVDCSLE